MGREGSPTELLAIIDGRAVRAASGETFESVDPSTGSVIASIVRGTAKEVDEAVASARYAFDRTWSEHPPLERGQVLLQISDLILDRVDELSYLEALDTGKPLREARLDINIAARYFEFYGQLADKAFGETIPVSPNALAYTVREPFGVTAHIVPWNYPFAISARTVAPALAVGNCCVLKPAEQASLTPVRLGELALEADLPPGVLNVVPGFGHEAGRALADHRAVDHLSFTGSIGVGRQVMERAARNLTPVTMELGGKSPHIVFADANLAEAVPTIVRSILHNAGQTCSAGSRVLVDRRLERELIGSLEEEMKSVRLGRGVDDPDMGPLISAAQLERVLGTVRQAQRDGATVVTGGRRPDLPGLDGFFVEPTLLGDVLPESAVAQEEIFGPVLTVTRFLRGSEAINIANGTRYGLVAAVWTQDVDRALWAASRIQAGQVFINCYGAGVELPFGGWKDSGFGREKGTEALREYTQTKTVAAVFKRPER